jgi:DNA-binding NarL/FixJ family response regulator
VCVAEGSGRILFQNTAFRDFVRSGPHVRALRAAINDARSVALSRLKAVAGTRPSTAQVASFATDTHTVPSRFHVRCTVVRRTADARRLRETVVIWVRTPLSQRPAVSELRTAYGLTEREAHVGILIESGARTREIASALGISVHTARRHSEAVLRKLNVRSRLEVRSRLRGEP